MEITPDLHSNTCLMISNQILISTLTLRICAGTSAIHSACLQMVSRHAKHVRPSVMQHARQMCQDITCPQPGTRDQWIHIWASNKSLHWQGWLGLQAPQPPHRCQQVAVHLQQCPAQDAVRNCHPPCSPGLSAFPCRCPRSAVKCLPAIC
jgi:hypothetical protein